MTILEMHSWFDILQMKGNNIDFTQREKDHILNRAQLKYVNQLVYKVYIPSLYREEKAKNVYSLAESSADGFEQIRPLIREVTVNPLGAPAGAAQLGDIRYTDIETSLNNQSVLAPYNYPVGYDESTVMVVLGVHDANNNYRVRFVKTFESQKYTQNVFRQPKSHQPIYTINGDIVRVYPTPDNTTPYVVQIIKEPIQMVLDMTGTNSIDCELPDACHDEIMAIALDDAGIATRDQALMQLNAASKKDIAAAN